MVRGKLLIVENDRATREGLQFAFIRRDWEVVATTTAEEGLSLLLSGYKPDWIIACWDRLQGCGLGFVREVKAKATGVRLSILTEGDSRSGSFATNLQPELTFVKPVRADDVYSACTTH